MSSLELLYDNRYHTLWSWSDRNGSQQRGEFGRRIGRRVYKGYVGLIDEAPHRKVVMKMAHGETEVAALEAEANFYVDHLEELRGEVVPEFYGCYRGRINGVYIGCMILEYLSSPSNPMSQVDYAYQVMRAVNLLHKAGIEHRDLSNGRHLVPSAYGVRIVDFSKARLHHCMLYACQFRTKDRHPVECNEILELEQCFGIHNVPLTPFRTRSYHFDPYYN